MDSQIISILFKIGHYNDVLLIGIHNIDALVFARKAFLFTILLRLNVYLSNKTDVDSYNNLCSFKIKYYNHVHLIGIHDTNALVWQEKAFLFTILLRIKVYPSNETNLDSHNNI